MHKPRKTALVTGITGFVGSHLAERFRSSTENIDAIKDRLHLLEGDLADAHSDPDRLRPSPPDREREGTPLANTPIP